jgi:hypothetical protein
LPDGFDRGAQSVRPGAADNRINQFRRCDYRDQRNFGHDWESHPSGRDVSIDYNFTSAQTINGFQVFKGAADRTAPFAFNPDVSPARCQCPGLVFPAGDADLSDRPGHAEDLLANPGGYYIVVNTAANPQERLRAARRGAVASDACRLDEMGAQLDRIEQMLRDIGRVLGLNFMQ